jgi:Zn-dependent protease
VETETALERLRRLEHEERAAREGGAPSASAPARRGLIGGLIFAILFILTKGKVLLAALKLGPLLGTLSTMYLAILAYGTLFGVKLAALIVFATLVHELGHGVAAKLVGLKVSAPIFIPFVGAFIMMKEQPRTTWIEAVVGIGGPLAGTVAGIALLLAGITLRGSATGDMLLAAAWITLNLNLFNLTPIGGLDGDRISQPFRAWYWLPVIGGAIAVVLLAGQMLPLEGPSVVSIVMVLMLSVVKAVRVWMRERGARPRRLVDRLRQREYAAEADVPEWQRHAAALGFFVLLALLSFLAIYANHLRPTVNAQF